MRPPPARASQTSNPHTLLSPCGSAGDRARCAVTFHGRTLLTSSRARFSFSTLTRGSPRNPRSGRFRELRHDLVPARPRPRALATRGPAPRRVRADVGVEAAGGGGQQSAGMGRLVIRVFLFGTAPPRRFTGRSSFLLVCRRTASRWTAVAVDSRSSPRRRKAADGSTRAW